MTAKALQDPGFPTALTDSQATALGLKLYFHGTNYNGGNAPTVSGSGFSNLRSMFIPYQMQDGTWRMRFNIRGGNTSLVTVSITINGVTFSAQYNAIAVCQLTGATQALVQSFTDISNSTLVGQWSAAVNGAAWAGDVELASKPTWAY